MTDEKQKLTAAQVLEAGIDDWRPILGRIKARFRTGDFATGLALVDKIGEAAEAAGHHPDVSLTYPEVLVTLSSHDVGGITSRDVDLARRISGFAADLGAEADVAGLTQLELGLDTTRSEQNAPFYAALFGGEVKDGEPVDPSGQVPTVWWQDPTEEDPEYALPSSRSSSAGTWTCGCRTTRASVASRRCSTPAAGWSATGLPPRSG
ncbi:4a-hydroxytetrahydrobiopterin dehydratase [Luteipulveratus sp. YIM 133296]|uniref:Putative pterin-4-alpha-carbinolamine dehydratase n=1 Tax=Luteipulveratus flavus TaxID=3031728 RepID=A0ABT6CAV2_9MICO|nr:4a-hydroxytetrahydrobiopterin dehydratase [Luteipulveratus sp. YIM 133296]MDF8265663.1 4a-hydroxytetrahydrobiopterin dehydratase [Luteipulveratus sp. YIM 133296]